ncbi:MAG: bifunctional diaminohydroxyphosphoribosylaminopyrimidine deaminase/5-amino-6-(5-phosphoribosylamino)uracil reductase RibD, partial [Phycisphaeraceae bacterium]|nr:bifunctional diaminohydroxyphosphoribosylaminopyrimidine deaminase/5-amino-6-(5-phosphoribosylamino)uracil reductase RibD [Phycisphaeraceae bacterium]
MTVDARDHDRSMLERAVRTALRGHGEAEPNPSVGCVIADAAGRVVGEGRTTRPGGPHGEIVALRQAGTAARGGVAWTTLEPCNHHGRTPPCVDALIEAGIARLVVGSVETNEVASGGIARLRDAGIEVEIRSDVDAVRRLHAGFHRRVSTGRPWVVAKWAETFDGALATPPGVSPWISGRRALRMVHRERGRVDAILTGIGTVIADDPRLDARDVRRRRTAKRIVIDPDLQFPADAAMLRTPGGEVVIACRPEAATSNPDAVRGLEAAGARIIPV